MREWSESEPRVDVLASTVLLLGDRGGSDGTTLLADEAGRRGRVGNEAVSERPAG